MIDFDYLNVGATIIALLFGAALGDRGEHEPEGGRCCCCDETHAGKTGQVLGREQIKVESEGGPSEHQRA